METIRVGCVLVGLVLTVTGGASLARARLQGPPPPPPPAADYFPSKWDRFTFDDGHFSARFPGKPTETVDASRSDSTTSPRHDIAYLGLLSFSISYVDFPVRLADRFEIEELLQRTKNGMLGANQSARIAEERYTSVGRYKALYFQTEEDLDGTKVTRRIELVPVGARFYIVTVMGRHGDPNELEGADNFAKIARGFFDSFEVVDRTEPKAN
jgi:hypothetical protein